MQETKVTRVWSLGREDPLEEEMATPVFLHREFHGQRSMVGHCPRDRKESDTTKATEHVLTTITYQLLYSYDNCNVQVLMPTVERNERKICIICHNNTEWPKINSFQRPNYHWIHRWTKKHLLTNLDLLHFSKNESFKFHF